MEELGAPIEACPCGHAYHKSCIREWIQQKRICPQCKGDALPLIPLHFNLYKVDSDSRGVSSAELKSSLKVELSTIKLSIDTELAEINILEPQLAECEAENDAYKKGKMARTERKNKLEIQLEEARFKFADAEKKHKELHQESESMRAKMSRGILEFSESSVRRPIQSSEIPKVMSFLVSDAKKLREIEVECSSLKGQLAEYRKRKSKQSDPLVKTSINKHKNRMDGFVPIDAIGHRRKLDEDRAKDLENRKPTLNMSFSLSSQTLINDIQNNLSSLSDLVSLLSDSEDPTTDLNPSTVPSSSLLSFLSWSQGVT